ncbi:MAG: hypothetical protein JWM31_1038 [Solirubrobacterales bacterium]|nr:hypothetical protein [Solirubrobacterales bacterium]
MRRRRARVRPLTIPIGPDENSDTPSGFMKQLGREKHRLGTRDPPPRNKVPLIDLG